MAYLNVGENWMLYDSVIVSGYVGTSTQQNPGGWFQTITDFSGANSHSFFNVRNRNVGLAYNNQDTRDQTAFAIELQSIGMEFYAPSFSLFTGGGTLENELQHWWVRDLPNHCALVFSVNQDDRTKLVPPMLPSGTGPFGGVIGNGVNASTANDVTYCNVSAGWPDSHKRQFQYPTQMGIPRRAAIRARLEVSQYARDVMAQAWDIAGTQYYSVNFGGTVKSAAFGIRVILKGKRLVQQRGEYHA